MYEGQVSVCVREKASTDERLRKLNQGYFGLDGEKGQEVNEQKDKPT